MKRMLHGKRNVKRIFRMKHFEFISAIFKAHDVSPRPESWLNNPEFEKADRIHDWRNHVSDIYKKEWKNLTYREKVIIYCEAEYEAHNEEWE